MSQTSEVDPCIVCLKPWNKIPKHRRYIVQCRNCGYFMCGSCYKYARQFIIQDRWKCTVCKTATRPFHFYCIEPKPRRSPPILEEKKNEIVVTKISDKHVYAYCHIDNNCYRYWWCHTNLNGIITCGWLDDNSIFQRKHDLIWYHNNESDLFCDPDLIGRKVIYWSDINDSKLWCHLTDSFGNTYAGWFR